jgi:hypothetical protein
MTGGGVSNAAQSTTAEHACASETPPTVPFVDREALSEDTASME